MRFSLILPIYNVDCYLEQCLISITKQDFKDFECLLIDDGSTDNSAEICNHYANKDPRFKYFHKQNGGLSDARNFGLQHASGNYIVFIDSDDVVSPVLLSSVIRSISFGGADAVYFEHVKFFGEVNDCLPSFETNITDESFSLISSVELSKKPNFAWARVVHKSFYDNNLFPVGHIYEDILTSSVLNSRLKAIGYINKGLYGYRKRINSITTGSAEQQFNLFKTLDLLKTKVLTDKISPRFYSTAFVNLIQSCLVSLVRIDDCNVRAKYINLICEEYKKISILDVLTSFALNKYKILTLFAKSKFLLFIISLLLRPIVKRSDAKGL